MERDQALSGVHRCVPDDVPEVAVACAGVFVRFPRHDEVFRGIVVVLEEVVPLQKEGPQTQGIDVLAFLEVGHAYAFGLGHFAAHSRFPEKDLEAVEFTLVVILVRVFHRWRSPF